MRLCFRLALLLGFISGVCSVSLFGSGLVKYPGLEVGAGADDVVAGDFNGDGRIDIIASSRQGQSLFLFLGNGDGTFLPGKSILSSPYPFGLAVADFNRDGRLDLAVADQGTAPSVQGHISILLGNGDGTFQKSINYTVGMFPSFVNAVDANEDGITDLLVIDPEIVPPSAQRFFVMLGNGDGTFQVGPPYTVGHYVGWPAVGDFNNDGHVDFAIPIFNIPGFAAVFFGNGDGTFQAGQYFNSGGGAAETLAAAAGDFNQDGNVDIVLCNFASFGPQYSVLTELLGDGHGNFKTAVPFDAGYGCANVSTADLDGDGLLDVITSSGEVGDSGKGGIAVLRGLPSGGFGPAVSYRAAAARMNTSPGHVTLADFTGNGPLDVAVADYSPNGVSIFLNSTGTDMTLMSSVNPAHVGQAVTFTGAVTDSSGAQVPTGTVKFADNQVILGLATLKSGQAILTTSFSAAGTHNIQAQYRVMPPSIQTTRLP